MLVKRLLYSSTMAKYTTTTKVVRLHLNKDDEISSLDVLRALHHHQKEIIGAQASYNGQAIDIVCANETTAVEIATHGLNHEDRHYDLRVASRPRVHVSVFVPIGMPDDVLAELMAGYGKVQHTRRLHYKESDLRHYENGVRVIEFDALTPPISSRVNFAGINIGFKYTGQHKTCVRCISFDHLVKDCMAARLHAVRKPPTKHIQAHLRPLWLRKPPTKHIQANVRSPWLLTKRTPTQQWTQTICFSAIPLIASRTTLLLKTTLRLRMKTN